MIRKLRRNVLPPTSGSLTGEALEFIYFKVAPLFALNLARLLKGNSHKKYSYCFLYKRENSSSFSSSIGSLIVEVDYISQGYLARKIVDWTRGKCLGPGFYESLILLNKPVDF